MFIWGQSRPEQARGKPEPWVCPLFRPTMGAPGSDMPQEPEDLCSIRRPPLTIGQRALSPKSSHFSSSKRDVTAFLRFSKAVYTKAALTIGLCTCCSLCLICSSPRFLHGWLFLVIWISAQMSPLYYHITCLIFYSIFTSI